jgi:hypothetical protein
VKYIACLLVLLFCLPALGQSPIMLLPDKPAESRVIELPDKDEKKIIAIIRAVPEVKSFYRYSPKSATIVYNGGPEPGRKYYWAQVGYGDKGMMRTIYHFYVAPKTFQIFYVDLITSRGSEGILTLKQWRQLRTTPGWQKPHYYNKAGKLIVDTEQ